MFYSDGTHVTVDDLIFFYHFIADASYNGAYSDWYLNNIEGLSAVYIGPDLWKNKQNPLFTEDRRLWKKWRNSVADDKFKVRCGYWEIPGRPKVILVDYTAYFDEKESFYNRLWNEYHVDSLHAYGDYDDSVLFGYAVGQVIESFYKYYLTDKTKIVVQAHEWQSGSAALYIKKYIPTVGTIFTTHATSIGRSIASNGKPLYDYFDGNLNLEQAVENLKMQTRRYAKRQLTWFKRVENVRWFYPDNEDYLDNIITTCEQFLKEE